MSSAYGAKEEVKIKTDIVALISEYVKVKKAGASFMAICPFHSEKSASLHVSPDKGMWYCHGCGEGGDVFGFIMRMEGLEFGEALRFLARKAGVTLSETETREQSERTRLQKINGAAAKYYHEVLRKHPAAATARAYAAGKRNLTDATIDAWLIGYSMDAWEDVIGFLKQKSVSDEEIFKAGLASKSTSGKGYFDRFRNRLMFPILDHNGNCVGFTARVMPGPDGKDPKDEAKYVNTSQTLVYNKSHVLFGLHAAKQEIKKKNLAVVVEGNMDVIASHQAGVANVVGSSGTSFTHEQLTLLKRFCDRLVLSFDNDAAGETAARRSIDAAVHAGFSVRILRMADGIKDPDDCIKQGVEVWTGAIAAAVPYMEWYLGLAKARTNFHDPDSVRTQSDTLLKEVAKLASPVERSFWIREVSQMFDTPESVLFETVQRLTRGLPSAPPAQAGGSASAPAEARRPALPPKPKLTRLGVVSQHLLGLAFCWPELASTAAQETVADHLDEDYQSLFSAYQSFVAATQEGTGTTEAFRAHLDAQGSVDLVTQTNVLTLMAEKEFGELDAGERKVLLSRLIAESRKLFVSRRQMELKAAMFQAEKSGDMAVIQDVQRQMGELLA